MYPFLAGGEERRERRAGRTRSGGSKGG